MRLYSFVAAAALASASLAAHADTMLTETFTANGSSTKVNNFPSVKTTSFQEFNPALGVLNSITIAASGTATSSDYASFDGFVSGDNRFTLTYGSGGGIGSFTFSVIDGTDTFGPALSSFYGTGQTNLLASFIGGDVTTSATTGSITYNYTVAALPVAATPEPSSFALLGTGLLGALGVARKRFA